MNPYGYLASLGGKVLAAIIGALLVVGMIWYIGHTRAENVRLHNENARYAADIATLRKGARIAMELTVRRENSRSAREAKLEKDLDDLRTRTLPNLPAICDRNLDIIRDALSGSLRSEGPASRDRGTSAHRLLAGPR